MSESIVRHADAGMGSRGERLLARGQQVALRVWEHEPAGETAPEHANDYEYVGFIVEGAMRVRIGELAGALGLEPDLHRHDLAALRRHPHQPGEEAQRTELWGLTAELAGAAG